MPHALKFHRPLGEAANGRERRCAKARISAVEPHVFLVGEVAIEEGGTAADHSRIDNPHHPRGDPRADIGIELDASGIVLDGARRSLCVRYQQEWISHLFNRARIPRMQSGHERTAIGRSSFGLKESLNFGRLRTQLAADQISSEVTWNAVKAAAWNDSNALCGGAFVVPINKRADPKRLAGDVHIIGAESYTSINNRPAIK